MADIIDVQSIESETLEVNDVISLKNISEDGYELLVQYNSQIMSELNTLNVDSLIEDIDDDNLKELKSIRTDVRKESKAIEDRRKAIEKLYNQDLQKWKDMYKKYAFSPLDKVDKKIKVAVDKYEDKLRADKSERFKKMFESKKSELAIDFVDYDDINLNVQLSSNENDLEEQVHEFFEKIQNDLKIINLGTHKERVLAEYEKYLDLSSAIINVNQSIAREEQIAERVQAKIEAEAQKEAQHEAKEEKPDIKTDEVEELITARIIVTGTKQQLQTLQAFMRNNGIKYE